MIEKTFYQFFIEINLDPSKAQKVLLDKRITQNEKKIIESLLFIRDNKNSEALLTLKSITKTPLPIAEVIKKILIGIVLNNQSNFQKSEDQFLEALKELEPLQCYYLQFMAHFNLFVLYLNAGNLKNAGETLEALKKIPREHEFQDFRVKRCELDYYVETDELRKANNILLQIEASQFTIPESDTIPYLITKFILHVKEEKFHKCQTIIQEMKKHRKFHLTENFNYMKKLIDHLIHDAPIYLSSDSFSKIPLINHQIRLIAALEERSLSEASKHWEALKLLSPDLYKDSFNYTGPKCLFSVCLKKHEQAISLNNQSFRDQSQNQTDSVLELLGKTQNPIHKSYLYEYLWGKPPEEKDDFKKLSRLITKIRSERGIDISYKKGTYFINKVIKKNRAS